MLGEGSDADLTTPTEKTFLFGKGLTSNGIHLLGLQLANMSIGDLEVFLIMCRMDPIQMYELAVTMKDLFVTLVGKPECCVLPARPHKHTHTHTLT
jgi:hypothetical protein